MKPLTVDVVTYAPTAFYHCQHCELTFTEIGLGGRLRRDQAAGALPDDLAREYQALSDWVHDQLLRHGSALRFRIVDAASIEGFVASFRHRLRRYPAVIIDGRKQPLGTNFAALDPVIDERLRARSLAS